MVQFNKRYTKDKSSQIPYQTRKKNSQEKRKKKQENLNTV